jgi:hypothetical protein
MTDQISTEDDLPTELERAAQGWEQIEDEENAALCRRAADAIRTYDNKLFELQWAADQQAIKRWQKATVKTKTWPDQTDLVGWPLERLDEAAAPTLDREAVARVIAPDIFLWVGGRFYSYPNLWIKIPRLEMSLI